MKVHKIAPEKSKAQAMVEFAIVLPILLLLLYGLLEAGRLLFIYSTIVTASRQAVRYGSATGEGNSGVPRYQDCAGIRAAAQRVDFLRSFEDDDIIIKYDTGPGSPASTNFCGGEPVTSLPATDTSFNPATNSYRLLVRIEGDYLPIVPKIVPFLSRSNGDSPKDPIKSESARTVLVSVAIQVTVPPSTWIAASSTATPSPTPTDTPTPTNTPTPTPSPTVVNTNTPTATPTPTLTLTSTLSPTVTSTATLTATIDPSTPVACLGINHGPVEVPGLTAPTGPGNNTMSMWINNPNPYPLTIRQVIVHWDHDKGYSGQGLDKDLNLIGASLGGQFWSGSVNAPSYDIPLSGPVIIPPNSTPTITFTFHRTYNRSSGNQAERIFIAFSTPGCQNFFINASR